MGQDDCEVSHCDSVSVAGAVEVNLAADAVGDGAVGQRGRGARPETKKKRVAAAVSREWCARVLLEEDGQSWASLRARLDPRANF
jgi:hypothetical protein